MLVTVPLEEDEGHLELPRPADLTETVEDRLDPVVLGGEEEGRVRLAEEATDRRKLSEPVTRAPEGVGSRGSVVAVDDGDEELAHRAAEARGLRAARRATREPSTAPSPRPPLAARRRLGCPGSSIVRCSRGVRRPSMA